LSKKTEYHTKERDSSLDPDIDFMLCLKYGIEPPDLQPRKKKAKKKPSAPDTESVIRSEPHPIPEERREIIVKKEDLPQSMKLKPGDRVINIDELSAYYLRTGVIRKVNADPRHDWESLGFLYAPTIATIEIDTGETIRAHEQYWYPVRKNTCS
jgi:hypothetical protein